MELKIFDNTFGICPAALTVANLLNNFVVETDDNNENSHWINVKTFPFYNGREHGICLEVRNMINTKEALYINFGENRNSDDLFVAHVWRTPHYNCPSVEEGTIDETTYENRKYFNCESYYACSRYIIELIEQAISKLNKPVKLIHKDNKK